MKAIERASYSKLKEENARLYKQLELAQGSKVSRNQSSLSPGMPQHEEQKKPQSESFPGEKRPSLRTSKLIPIPHRIPSSSSLPPSLASSADILEYCINDIEQGFQQEKKKKKKDPNRKT